MIMKINDSIGMLQWGENITLKNVEQFRHNVERLISQKEENLILNLANTNYINSAGLGIIAESVMSARKNHKELVLAEITEAVQEIFEIVKFTSFMKIFQSEQDAIDYFMRSYNEKD